MTTDLQGGATFSVPYVPTQGSPIITDTETDAIGTTSEFSAPLGYSLTATGVLFNAMAGTPFSVTVANFAAPDLAASAANFTASINWGDNSTTPGTVVAGPGGFLVVGSHTFSAANPAESMTVTITDTRNGVSATAHSVATVAPAPLPIITPFTKIVPFVAAQPSTAVVLSFADPDPRGFPGQFFATINWGDGSLATAGTISADGAGFDVFGQHTYNLSGNFAIIVIVHDAATNVQIAAQSTAVVDPVPIKIMPKAFAVTGKKRFSGSLATFADGDPRVDPTFYTATIDWGDGSPHSAGTITGSNPFTVSGSHIFPAFQNTHLVTITVTDKNGRTATIIDRVVDPPDTSDSTTDTDPGQAAPPATLGAINLVADGLALPRNRPYSGVVATFSDSGPALPSGSYRAMIQWGKGRAAGGPGRRVRRPVRRRNDQDAAPTRGGPKGHDHHCGPLGPQRLRDRGREPRPRGQAPEADQNVSTRPLSSQVCAPSDQITHLNERAAAAFAFASSSFASSHHAKLHRVAAALCV